MPSSELQFGLSWWRGEFLEAATENDFRAHTAESSARDLRMALWAWMILLALLSVLDFRLFGAGGAEYVVILTRVLLVAGLLLLIFRSHDHPEVASSGYAVTALEVIGFFSFFLLYFSHAGTMVYTIVITLLMLVAVFVVIPNRLVPATGVAVFGTTGTMYCAWLLDADENIVISLLLFLLSSCFLGYLASRRQHLTHRRQFALLRKTEEINAVLSAEIERRKLLEQELQQQAITDPLTGLFNRRHFESLFERERRRAARNSSALCLCLVDLDYFKRINDEHGHEMGDRVLQQTAGLFIARLRQTDLVGRIGGEEFVLLLPDTAVDAAQQLIEHLRQSLAGDRLRVGQLNIGITATFSVTGVDAARDTLVSVLRLADKALYDGKAAGRNCVVLAER